jgi:spermidine synthase
MPRNLSGWRVYAVAFAVAAVTLSLQILAHRVVSAKFLNNYAFFVISLTMLGFTLSGILLTRWLEPALAHLRSLVSWCAAGLVTTTLGAICLLYWVHVGRQMPQSRPEFVFSFLANVPLALLLAVPFTFSGLILGGLLAAPTLNTRRVYGCDLLGSACGAFIVLPAISAVGVETAILLSCGVFLAATTAATPPTNRGTRIATAAAILSLCVVGFGRGYFLQLRYPEASTLRIVQSLPAPFGIEHVEWDPISRIEVSRIPPPDPTGHPYACLIGSNRSFHRRFERMLTQNNFAFTYAAAYDGNKESLRGIEETVYTAAYHASSVSKPQVLIIGVGGGFDVLSALAFDPAAITGVEINAATVRILRYVCRDYFRNWVEDPRVRLVQAEGRQFLAASNQRYDVIQLSGVDSYAGTAAAAHVFSESYLYTEEAFDLYLSRLGEQGILNVMRLEYVPPREMLKALVTAIDALRRRGVADPRQHVLMISATSGQFSAMLVKKTPFSATEVGAVKAWVDRTPFLVVSAIPGGDSRGGLYARVLALPNAPQLHAVVAAYPFAIAPATDDRPFFFRHSYWWHLFARDPTVRASVPVMELSVLLLLALVGLAAVACVWLPLRYLVRRGSAKRGSWREAVFFGGAGFGYMVVEIAVLQKFGLFLGHPNYALSVVLASLLLFSGLGALASQAILRRLAAIRFAGYLVCLIILAEHAVSHALLPRLIGWPFVPRVALVFLLVAPLGLGMGVFLPWAIERLKRDAPSYIPWAWGLNGICSVLAPVLGVAFAMSWGISALLLSAIPIYLGIGLVYRE